MSIQLSRGTKNKNITYHLFFLLFTESLNIFNIHFKCVCVCVCLPADGAEGVGAGRGQSGVRPIRTHFLSGRGHSTRTSNR